MIGKFNSFECLEQGCGLIPNVEPDAFAVAPCFDSTEELRVEIDDTDETRPVRYTSDVRLILHTKDLASPIAVKTSLLLLIDIVTVVFSSSASAICEAMVRFHIKSYSFFSCAVPSMDWFSI